MSERPVKIILQDILAAIQKIGAYTEGMNEEQFLASEMVKDAVIRNLEIIGEATNRLPEDFLVKHHSIEWHKIISMRNRLIHGYFHVNERIVWITITGFIAPLKEQLSAILQEDFPD